MAKRRGNNEGTICQLPSGSWRAQIYINGHRISKTKKSKKEAQLWLRKTLEKTSVGYTGIGSQILYKDYLQEWLKIKKSNLKKSTWNLYEISIRVHIAPFLGEKKIRDIEPLDIQNLYLLKREQGVGSRSILVMHTIISNSLKNAVIDGRLIQNPAKSIPTPRYSSPEMDFYSEHEISQLLLAVNGTSLEALIQIAITTGMRQSEILALKWSDVDWDRNRITIQRQLKRNYSNDDYYSSLKTSAGKRTISLGLDTIRKLQEHHKRQAIEKLNNSTKWEENDLIFPSLAGTPIGQRNLLRKFKKVLRESGLREIRFHDLRHTAASLMLNHGVPTIIVSKRMGHSKVSITLDTYGHLLPSMQQDTANFIDGLVTPVEVKLHTNCTRVGEN